MKTRSHIVVATAVALATGLSLNLIGSDARTTEEPLSAAPVSGVILPPPPKVRWLGRRIFSAG